mmetsp:Transcript_28240/g.91313  ORF Transcript_28240/g.91313 Transcript_28240/m.91313 type:complete len:303 (-) Transcript_28240:918-1826(-)
MPHRLMFAHGVPSGTALRRWPTPHRSWSGANWPTWSHRHSAVDSTSDLRSASRMCVAAAIMASARATPVCAVASAKRWSGVDGSGRPVRRARSAISLSRISCSALASMSLTNCDTICSASGVPSLGGSDDEEEGEEETPPALSTAAPSRSLISCITCCSSQCSRATLPACALALPDDPERSTWSPYALMASRLRRRSAASAMSPTTLASRLRSRYDSTPARSSASSALSYTINSSTSPASVELPTSSAEGHAPRCAWPRTASGLSSSTGVHGGVSHTGAAGRCSCVSNAIPTAGDTRSCSDS